MAAKIKLSRMGMKKQPTYRVVIQEEHSKRDGRFIENLGYYNPRTDPPTIVLNQERVTYWLGVGALPTDSVGRLLRTAGLSEKYSKMHVSNKTAAAPGTDENKDEMPATPPGEVTSASTEITEGTEKPAHVSSDEPADG